MSLIETFYVVRKLNNKRLNAFVQAFAFMLLAAIAVGLQVAYGYLIFSISKIPFVHSHVSEGVVIGVGLGLYILTLLALAIRELEKPY